MKNVPIETPCNCLKSHLNFEGKKLKVLSKNFVKVDKDRAESPRDILGNGFVFMEPCCKGVMLDRPQFFAFAISKKFKRTKKV